MDKLGREALAKRILALSTADETEVLVLADSLALTRFTHEDVIANIASTAISLRVRVVHDKRCGVATTTGIEDADLQDVLARAQAIAALCPRDDGWPGLPATPTKADAASNAFDQATAESTADARADQVANIFTVSEAHGQWGAGYVSTSAAHVTIANSHGRCVSADGTEAVLNIKQNAPDSTGYAEGSGPAFAAFDAADIAQIAAGKAVATKNPQPVEPGDWTVILEPVALGELLSYLTDHFSAQAVADGNSFLGWDSLNTQVAAPGFTMIDNWQAPLAPGLPFDYEGTTRQIVPLIENGIAKNVVTDSRWAARLARTNTGHALPAPNSGGPQPLYVTVSPGSRSLEELISSTKRGLLISRFWYIRPVDRRKTIVTGMTRDGTFLIEDGKLRGGVHNLRFNQSIIGALQHIELGNELKRTSGLGYTMVVPAARINNFHFSSSTSF